MTQMCNFCRERPQIGVKRMLERRRAAAAFCEECNDADQLSRAEGRGGILAERNEREGIRPVRFGRLR